MLKPPVRAEVQVWMFPLRPERRCVWLSTPPLWKASCFPQPSHWKLAAQTSTPDLHLSHRLLCQVVLLWFCFCSSPAMIQPPTATAALALAVLLQVSEKTCDPTTSVVCTQLLSAAVIQMYLVARAFLFYLYIFIYSMLLSETSDSSFQDNIFVLTACFRDYRW